jgi:hypothetical protein
MSFSLPEDKILKIQASCKEVLSDKHLTVRVLAQLLGQLNACAAAVLPAPLHFRQLQMLKTRALIQGQSYEAPVNLSPECREELRWWIHHLEIWNGKGMITPGPDMILTSDASKRGWGATWGPQKTQGLWSPQERLLHINVLVLMAAIFAVRSFAKNQSNLHIHPMVENTTTVAQVNKMGGTRSLLLFNVVKEL